MSKTVHTKILLRNDTATRWASENPILAKGEIGIEIDTKKFKFGDGTTAWNTLSYGSGADIAKASASVDGLLSKEDFAKLQNIASGAEVNVQADWSITDNSSDAFIKNKPSIPSKTSDLTNDSGFITTNDIPEGAAASTTTPAMDGTAAVGTELAFARGDHVHPTDTSRASASDLTALETKVDNVLTSGAVTAIATGSGNGQIAVTVTSTSGTTSTSQVSVYGLGSAAYEDVTNTYNASGTAPVSGQAVASAISTAISSVFKYKGTKATVDALPSSGNSTGDVWHVTANDSEYAWTGSEWEELGGVVDLSSYLSSISIAGLTINASGTSITASQLQTALGLGAAAYKAVDSSIGSTPGANLPTSEAVANYVSSHATQVAASSTNGNITVDSQEVTVYTLPSTVLHSSDTLILDCGNSTTNYTAS